MVSKLRRLIADHADLHNNELPPNYLFSPTDSHSDDMTQLVVMLAGPQGTPYSAGLWRLQLRIPQDYPARPPTATFKTRIWHPNVEQSTGAVCVDTLKRDWVPDLTLRDILVTISCLLIHPNPDSALNAMAGSLLQDDYDEFARQARLMTSIHAPVPFNLKDAVLQAKRRGEDPELAAQMVDMHEARDLTYGAKNTSLFTKKSDEEASILQTSKVDEDMEDVEDNCKENDPPTVHAPAMSSSLPQLQRRVLRNRPLSIIPTTPVLDTDMIMLDCGTDDEGEWSIGMTASEQNIAANIKSANFSLPGTRNSSLFSSTSLQQTAYASSKISSPPTTNNDSTATSYAIFEDYGHVGITKSVRDAEKASYGKENVPGFLPLSSKEPSEALSSSCPPEVSIVQSLLLKSRAPSSPPLSSSKTVAAKPLSPTKVTKSIYINSNNIENRSGSGIGNTRKTKASKGRQRTGLRRL